MMGQQDFGRVVGEDNSLCVGYYEKQGKVTFLGQTSSFVRSLYSFPGFTGDCRHQNMIKKKKDSKLIIKKWSFFGIFANF